MKKALMVAFSVSLVAGCSSMPASTDVDDTFDSVYVAQIENAARRFGTQVTWINLPQKRSKTAQSQ